ncbi:MAG: hypothetical protein HN742_25020 [Lentisphaerae bacterium]|nr:hypothetical protein [Lentisphaerota bacterium]
MDLWRSTLTAACLLAAIGADAHWETHDHLPRYARRGVLRACVAPFNGPQLDTWLDVDPLGSHFNLIFTAQPAWEHPIIQTDAVVSRYLQPRGGNLFFYTCPNSIYFNDEFERVDYREDVRFERHRWDTLNRFPYAKDQITWGRDGKPIKAYVWPSTRHRTSYFSERWLEHHFQVMSYMVEGKAAVTNKQLVKWLHDLDHPGIHGGYYYDNAGVRHDWGPLAMKKWKEVSRREFGKVIDPRSASDLRVRMFWDDMQHRAYIEYCDALRKHAWSSDRPRLSIQGSRGAPAYYAGEYDFPDIEFYENSGKMLPQTDSIWDLKCGLARTHGKAQALLTHDHFPRPRLDRSGGFRVLNWTLTEEYARLMLAESLALNAAHMVQIGAMTYDTMRYGPQVTQYNTFNRELEELVYREARLAARLAVMSPIASEAHGSASNAPLGERLWRQGWAYDVVIEHDVTPAIWPEMKADVLVLPDVRCLNEPRLQVLLDWVRAGGKALISQALATRDELGIPRTSVLASQLLGSVPTRVSFSAAYDCQLTGFVVEKEGRVWLPMNFHEKTKTLEGTVTADFSGADGQYDVRIVHLDESDGVSNMTVLQNGSVLTTFTLDKDTDRRHVKQLPGIAIRTGDRFEVRARMDKDGEEFCRIYDLEFVPVGADLNSVTYRDVGKGLVAYAPQSLMLYTDGEFEAILTRLSGGHGNRVTYSPGAGDLGSVFMNIMTDHAGRATQAHIVNATYQTPERYATITSTGQVIRAQVALVDVPANPVLRVLAFGVGKDWQLAATVNGTALTPVDAAAIRNTAWVEFPVERALLKPNAPNEITVRGAGAVDAYGAHVAVYLDATQTVPDSDYSTDGGKTFSGDDLSALNGIQTGAYMVTIGEASRVKMRPEMRTRLVRRSDVQLQLSVASAPEGAQGLMISPDLPPRRLTIEREVEHARISVPELDVYCVVLVSTDAAYLEAVEEKARGLRFNPSPARTPEFNSLLAEGILGERLPAGDLEGDFRLRGVEQIDPASVSARNGDRYFAKDLVPGKDFVVFPDGRLEALPGTFRYLKRIFLTWSESPGDHYRAPHRPYMRLGDTILLPPGWSFMGRAPETTTVGRADQPGEFREGAAGVRITAKTGAGLSSGTEWLDIGRPYVASVWIKVAAGQALVTITNGTDQTMKQTCKAGDWKRVELRFVAQHSRAAFRITAANPEGDSTFFVDGASVREAPR